MAHNLEMKDITDENKGIRRDCHRIIKRPEKHKSQGKKIKRALFWQKGKRPKDRAPKGFINRNLQKKISEQTETYGQRMYRKMFGIGV